MNTQFDQVVSRMLDEIQRGDGLSLAAAGRQYPGHRGRPAIAPSTIFRWATAGVKTGGATVKLEALRLGSRWVTTKGALARFAAALTAAAAPSSDESTTQTTPTPAARQRAADHAAAALKAAGA